MRTSVVMLVAFSIAMVPSHARAQASPKLETTSNQSVQDELTEIRKELDASKHNLDKQHERLTVVRSASFDQPPPGNGRFAIVFRNDMSQTFVPVKCEVSVDGYTVYSKASILGIGQKETEIYRGTLTPGDHQINVTLTMKGTGSGAFPYLKDYRFIGRAGHLFHVVDDKLTQVKIVSAEKSGVAPKDRPVIEFDDVNWNINVPAPSGQ